MTVPHPADASRQHFPGFILISLLPATVCQQVLADKPAREMQRCCRCSITIIQTHPSHKKTWVLLGLNKTMARTQNTTKSRLMKSRYHNYKRCDMVRNIHHGTSEGIEKHWLIRKPLQSAKGEKNELTKEAALVWRTPEYSTNTASKLLHALPIRPRPAWDLAKAVLCYSSSEGNASSWLCLI